MHLDMQARRAVIYSISNNARRCNVFFRIPSAFMLKVAGGMICFINKQGEVRQERLLCNRDRAKQPFPEPPLQ